MKRHAAFPDTKQRQRIAQEIAKSVKQDIPDSAAEDNAQGDVEHQIVHLFGGPAGIGLPDAIATQRPAGQKTQQVHQAVPAHVQRPQAERHRVKIRMNQHEPSVKISGSVDRQPPRPSSSNNFADVERFI